MEGIHTDRTLGLSTGLAALALSVLLTLYVWVGVLFVRGIADRLTEILGQLSRYGF